MTDVAISRPIYRRPRVWIGLGAVVLVIGFLVLWNNVLRDQFFARNFGVVEEQEIFRSGQISTRLIKPTLQEHGIESIVSLIGTCRRMDWVEAEKKLASEMSIEWTNYPLDGNGLGNIDSYAGAIEAIFRAKQKGKPVLVHCFAGTQRTGGVVACYRLLVEKADPEQAVKEMRRYGWDKSDNPMIVSFLNEHMGELAQKLVARGVIAQAPDPLPKVEP